MSMNSGGNSLFSACFMAECKSHINFGLFFFSVAVLAVYAAFSVWKKSQETDWFWLYKTCTITVPQIRK